MDDPGDHTAPNYDSRSHKKRLDLDNGTFLYVYPDDILLVESNGHYSIVWAAANGHVFKGTRPGTVEDVVKEFSCIPLLRFHRFGAINNSRYFMGNYKKNEIAFTGGFTVKPLHCFSKWDYKKLGS